VTAKKSREAVRLFCVWQRGKYFQAKAGDYLQEGTNYGKQKSFFSFYPHHGLDLKRASHFIANFIENINAFAVKSLF